MSYCESERLSRGFRKFTHWPKPEELSIALANVYAARKVKSAALRSTVICPAWYTELARLAVKLLSWLKRSEEHTSELQSRLHLVCRLLLEKKKNTRR